MQHVKPDSSNNIVADVLVEARVAGNIPLSDDHLDMIVDTMHTPGQSFAETVCTSSWTMFRIDNGSASARRLAALYTLQT